MQVYLLVLWRVSDHIRGTIVHSAFSMAVLYILCTASGRSDERARLGGIQ
jgi:hypothetical protein